MLNKMSLLLAATAVAVGAGAAMADPFDHAAPINEPSTFNAYGTNESDQASYRSGYNYGYDAGFARGQRDDHFRSDTYRLQTRYERGAYYYGNDCNGDTTAGLVVGGVAGGVIGNQFGHGDGRTAATVGGVILGGIVGSSIERDMNCNDRRYALTSYGAGFEGRIGQRYNWRNSGGGNYGSFTPTREYSRDGYDCRDFRDVSYHDGNKYDRRGSACRHSDGNWYLE